MIDQIKIGNKSSYDDFSASFSNRKIGKPKKKVIKETIPFSNITYDFSAINGELYWEERELEYTFEIIADTPEKLEELKSKFSSWVMNVLNEKLYDPFIPDYHFIATFSDMTPEDDEGLEKTTLTVKFTAYPYKISNSPYGYITTIEAGAEKEVLIANKSSHRMTPTITSDGAITLLIDNLSYSISAGTIKDERLNFKMGNNIFKIKNNTEVQVNVSFSIDIEVF